MLLCVSAAPREPRFSRCRRPSRARAFALARRFLNPFCRFPRRGFRVFRFRLASFSKMGDLGSRALAWPFRSRGFAQQRHSAARRRSARRSSRARAGSARSGDAGTGGAKKSKIYAVPLAVARGRSMGIFHSWAECEKAVNGFKGAVFKSFMSRDEALFFLEQNGVLVGDKADKNLDKTDKNPNKQLTEEQLARIQAQTAAGSGQRAPGSSNHAVCAGAGGLARGQRPSPAGGCAARE